MSNRLMIGVVGYCPPTKFDHDAARNHIREAYDAIDEAYPRKEKWVVSGLTNVGVLAIAYEEAVRRGWKTKGVACKRAMEHELFPVDEQVVVGDRWGDESETFLAGLDCMVRVGTGKQSLAECEQVRSRGLPTYEYDLLAL